VTLLTLSIFYNKVERTLGLVALGLLVLLVAIQVYYLYSNYVLVPPIRKTDNDTNNK